MYECDDVQGSIKPRTKWLHIDVTPVSTYSVCYQTMMNATKAGTYKIDASAAGENWKRSPICIAPCRVVSNLTETQTINVYRCDKYNADGTLAEFNLRSDNGNDLVTPPADKVFLGSCVVTVVPGEMFESSANQ